MREIKFRDFDCNTNQMRFFDLDGYDRYNHDCYGNIMQFTGLHDKNGVEIYEGDICKVLYTDWPSKSDSDPRTIKEYMNDIAKTCIVYYDFNGFYFTQRLQNPYSQDMDVSPHGFIEVIGNIHQNPELLK